MNDTSPHVSVVIPHYPINEEVETLLKRCVDSLSGYNQLVVVVNEGTGFGKAVNMGVNLSKEGYVVIVNNDCFISSGDIESLLDPDFITSPVWGMKEGPAVGNEFMPSFFCMTKAKYNEIGGFDETFKVGDYEDDDFYYRGIKKGFEFKYIDSVRIWGENGFTKDKIPGFYDTSRKNKERFIEKHGREPIKRNSILING